MDFAPSCKGVGRDGRGGNRQAVAWTGKSATVSGIFVRSAFFYFGVFLSGDRTSQRRRIAADSPFLRISEIPAWFALSAFRWCAGEGGPPGFQTFDPEHGRCASRAQAWPGLGVGGRRRKRLALPQVKGGADEGERPAFGRMMQAEVAHLHEPRRQHMLQETPDELLGLQLSHPALPGFRVPIAEPDRPVIGVKNGRIG